MRKQLNSAFEKTTAILRRLLTPLKKLTEKIKNSPRFQQWSTQLITRLRNIDFQKNYEKLQKLVQKKGMSFYGKLITVVLCSFFLADILALWVETLIPEPKVTSRRVADGRKKRQQSDYNVIVTRNLFNSRGIIPGEDGTANDTEDQSKLPPVKTTLPFNLVGILAMADPEKSVATIEDRSASLVYPVQMGDEIPSKIKVQEITSSRVIFLNLSNRRREYVELPEDPGTKNPRITLGAPQAKGGREGIEKIGENQFHVSRSEVSNALADFNNILTQARAVPNFENGVAAGYKLFQIVPGSIYDQLGLKNGDVITGLNGEPMNDPGKAFEMLNELKTSNHLELQVKKDGKQSTYVYDIE